MYTLQVKLRRLMRYLDVRDMKVAAVKVPAAAVAGGEEEEGADTGCS